MSYNSQPSRSAGCTPVIIASNPLRRLSPVSAPGRPYSIVRGKSGTSPLERLLETVSKQPNCGDPIIFCDERSTRETLQQCRDFLDEAFTLVAVPGQTGSGVIATLASVLATRLSRNAGLLFLPATITATNPLYLSRMIDAMAVSACEDDLELVHFLCQKPQNPQTAHEAIYRAQETDGHAAAGPVLTLLLSDQSVGARTCRVKRIINSAANAPGTPPLDEDTLAIYLQNDRVVHPLGACAVRGRNLLEIISETSPPMMKASQHAIDAGEVFGQVIRPRTAFLSLAGEIDLPQLIASDHQRVRVHVCDNSMSVVRNWADANTDTSFLTNGNVSITGNPDCHIIKYGDCVHAIAKGCENAVDFNHPPSPASASHLLQLARSETHELVEESSGVELWRISLPAGGKIAAECHFHRRERWIILSGQADVTLDGTLGMMSAGDVINIDPQAVHSITNSGTAPLVYYEMRAGSMMGDNDHLAVPQPRAVAT